MQIEKQQIPRIPRILQPKSKSNGLSIVDNRSFVTAQEKLKGIIQRTITQDVLNHIMQPQHTGNIPKGLHGYTGGLLPSNTESTNFGNTNHVHQVWWRTPQTRPGYCKWSTMFPSNMNKANIEAVLKVADKREGIGWPRQVQPLKGHSNIHINIMKKGSPTPTYFPILGTGSTPQSHLDKHTIGNSEYTVINPF